MFEFALVLPLLVALSDAWTPGARDRCNPIGVMGGSYVMPHERYCQVFLSCDLFGNQYQTLCPKPSLFAYGDGVSTCSVLGSTKYTCPKWSCSLPEHVGKRYPDVCCKKYWECTSVTGTVGKFSSRECGAGLSFNMNLEQCQSEARATDICYDDTHCYPDDFVDPNANTVYACPNSPISTDSCSYMTDGWDQPRKCPVGTSYKHVDCACTQFAAQCSGSGISQSQLNIQKQPDSSCRASGRIDFSKTPLATYSYKLTSTAQLNANTPVNVDHYYTNRSMSFSQAGGDFNGFGALLYDYYYVDNTLYSPLAISLTVKFTRPSSGFQANTRYNILENVYWNGASKYCNDATIGIYATFQSLVGGQNQWLFQMTARGEGASRALLATTEKTILGGGDDHYRVVYYFNNNLSGSVQNVGTSGRSQSGQKVNFDPSAVSLGGRIGTNKCGFSIGRNLSGRMTEFQVFEGCTNANNQNLASIPTF